ncbi:hypothetical protein GCM10009557_61880 [Virgisporangium ochraceum]
MHHHERGQRRVTDPADEHVETVDPHPLAVAHARPLPRDPTTLPGRRDRRKPCEDRRMPGPHAVTPDPRRTDRDGS